MDYAVELGLLETNPIRAIKWTAPKVSSQVDRRSVVNPRQARALLEAVRAAAAERAPARRLLRGDVLRRASARGSDQPRSGQRDPASDRTRTQQWHDPTMTTGASCTSAAQRPMRAASGPTMEAAREAAAQAPGRGRQPHRADPPRADQAAPRSTSPSSARPPTAASSAVSRGGELPTITYRRAWIKARQAALTAAEQASPLARRPYDLRHACLSTWLNGGVYPPRWRSGPGTAWTCCCGSTPSASSGQDELAKRRISEALRQD